MATFLIAPPGYTLISVFAGAHGPYALCQPVIAWYATDHVDVRLTAVTWGRALTQKPWDQALELPNGRCLDARIGTAEWSSREDFLASAFYGIREEVEDGTITTT